MCKTYEAIYQLKDYVESDILICYLNHLKVEGTLHSCDCNFKESRCYDGIVTLKDATVYCPKTDYKKEFAWLNIPSKKIEAFAFKCCEG